jgi:diamine N-acetyltransferase
VILGERIRLRAVERDDLPRYVRWFNDPELRSTLNMFLPMNIDDETKWFERYMDADPIERSFSIDALEGDKWRHIGGAGFNEVDLRIRKALLGISIGEAADRDRGYGTDAMYTLLRHGFETLNLNRIYLYVFEYNLRALHVYKKIGFVEEGRLRQDRYYAGDYHDTIILGILRGEWDKERGH